MKPSSQAVRATQLVVWPKKAPLCWQLMVCAGPSKPKRHVTWQRNDFDSEGHDIYRPLRLICIFVYALACFPPILSNPKCMLWHGCIFLVLFSTFSSLARLSGRDLPRAIAVVGSGHDGQCPGIAQNPPCSSNASLRNSSLKTLRY